MSDQTQGKKRDVYPRTGSNWEDSLYCFLSDLLLTSTGLVSLCIPLPLTICFTKRNTCFVRTEGDQESEQETD